ncbi:hypothetical protein RhiirC2_844624 [Rhizophagus irregularis]|uniref:Crinkler effector protein N-terminal domain-containing protein n=1 Tax=Rhizophagus irregularis TaxID=588596 RepID=A0A2N1NTA3_9GLOM|nr:hypothetical protein RhiirC2_844624 [Rhizophagus irregularis]
MVSINCLLLRKTSFHDTFAVNVANDNDIRDSLIKFDDLKISDLKYLIYNEINHDIEFNYDDIDLWKINIAYNDNKLKHVTTEDEFGGKKVAEIGKTCWGKEFFNSVKRHWEPLSEWEKSEYLYIILDFVSSIRFGNIDKNLNASTILVLCIAYDYFACKKMSFEIFQTLAQLLVIILHIDEYQEIFTFENNKGLFKEMMLTLGPLMTESNKDKEGYWMCNTSVLQLLYNTSGLPQALETVINKCFKKETFFLDVKNNNFTLFDDVAIPVDLDTVISKKLKVLTVKDLMRDEWLNIVPDTTYKMLQPDSKMVWDTLEKFVANYKVFHNNLFAKLKKYKKGISLKEFYRGAVSKDLVLEIKMGLKKLDLRNPNDLPDDCLIIAKRNFSQYFGLLFASQLSFDIVNHLNINSSEPKQIAERIDGIEDKRPNISWRTTLEKARTQLEDCSFALHSFFLDVDEHDLMIIDEYDEYDEYDSYSDNE